MLADSVTLGSHIPYKIRYTTVPIRVSASMTCSVARQRGDMNSRTLIGIDIGGTKTAISLGSEDGTIIDKIVFPNAPVVEEVLSAIYNAVDVLREKHHVSPSAMGMKVLGMTGHDGGVLKKYCDVCLTVSEGETFRVQELHLPIYHWLCISLEEALFAV